uniref:Uncharacterized protein n=1 Tax=Anguilla anguilla TaxID=7936 RepID=A0A0E9WTE7_ANGAN
MRCSNVSNVKSICNEVRAGPDGLGTSSADRALRRRWQAVVAAYGSCTRY